jgi:hypothetical protein
MKMPFKLDANAENTSRYTVCLNVPVDDLFGGKMSEIDRFIKTKRRILLNNHSFTGSMDNTAALTDGSAMLEPIMA